MYKKFELLRLNYFWRGIEDSLQLMRLKILKKFVNGRNLYVITMSYHCIKLPIFIPFVLMVTFIIILSKKTHINFIVKFL